jgi:hypothetical protein
MERQVQGALIGIAGLCLTGIQLLHAVTRTSTTIGLVVDAVPFSLMALTITYVGYWVARDVKHEDYAEWIGIWAVGGAIGFAAISALILFSANVAAGGFPVFDSAPALAIDNITAGALAGILVGLYDARSRKRLDELEHERERIERFANRSADMNNYGRALNECSTLEEVSALCIEALETLVDLSGTAFVELEGDELSIVDSTIIGVDDSVVGELAARATEQDPAVAENYASDLPDELGERVASVTVLQVTQYGGITVSIIALNRGEPTVEEETRALLEMLVSHAGTALQNIYSQPVVDDTPGPAAAGADEE